MEERHATDFFNNKKGPLKWTCLWNKKFSVSWTTRFYFDHKMYIWKLTKCDTWNHEIMSLFWTLSLLKYHFITVILRPLYFSLECRRLFTRGHYLKFQSGFVCKQAVSGSEGLCCSYELRSNDMWLSVLGLLRANTSFVRQKSGKMKESCYTGHTQKNGAVSKEFTIDTAPLFCVCPVYRPVGLAAVHICVDLSSHNLCSFRQTVRIYCFEFRDDSLSLFSPFIVVL